VTLFETFSSCTVLLFCFIVLYFSSWIVQFSVETLQSVSASFDDRRGGGLLNAGSGPQMQPAPPTYNGPAFGAAPPQQQDRRRFAGGYNESAPHQQGDGGYQNQHQGGGGGGRGGFQQGGYGGGPNQTYNSQPQYGARGAPMQNYNSYDNSGDLVVANMEPYT